MSSLSCIIVDDEPLAVRLLESYVEKTPDLELMASFTDSITAINAVKAQKPTPYGEEFPKPWPCQNFLVPLQAI